MRCAFGRGERQGSDQKKHKATTNLCLKLDDPRAEFQATSSDMLEFLRGTLENDKEERAAMARHSEQKAVAAMKVADAANLKAIAADKAATAALVKSKAELLDRVIKCSELNIEVPAELLEALKQ